jgi:hypothetical protein
MLLRWGLRLLLLAIVFSAIGFLSNQYAVFEVFRVAGGVCMGAGILFLVIEYVRTPQPPEA